MGFASLYPSYKRYEFAFSRRDAPELYVKLVPQKIKRAQGKPGALSTRSRAHKMHTGDHRCAGTPGLPCAMVLTAYSALPGDEFVLPPSLTD